MDRVNRIEGRLIISMVGMAAFFVILFGIRASASIINPILLALVITVTVLPIPSRLTKRGMPGWLALVLTILMVVLLLGLVIATVFFSIAQLTTSLPSYMSSASQQAASTTDPTTATQINQITLSMGPFMQGFLVNITNLLVQFGLALVIFFFMISAAISLPTPSRLGLDAEMPAINRVATLTEDVRKYMSVLTLVNFLVGLGNTIFLMYMGVDYAVLWGMLSWFMGYIPSVGFLIALIPPVFIAYAQYGLQTAVIVLIGYIVINGGVQNFYQPRVMGNRLKISPVVVFVGLFVWGYLLGGIGAILAVPMTLLVLILLENFESTRPLVILFRYTGEEKKEERKAAKEYVQDWWGGITRAIKSDSERKEAGE